MNEPTNTDAGSGCPAATCYPNDSIDYIRRTYGVPAEIGKRIHFLYSDSKGSIVGSESGRILVRFDYGRVLPLHPSWEIIYLEG